MCVCTIKLLNQCYFHHIRKKQSIIYDSKCGDKESIMICAPFKFSNSSEEILLHVRSRNQFVMTVISVVLQDMLIFKTMSNSAQKPNLFS